METPSHFYCIERTRLNGGGMENAVRILVFVLGCIAVNHEARADPSAAKKSAPSKGAPKAESKAEAAKKTEAKTEPAKRAEPRPVVVSTLKVEDLKGFSTFATPIQDLIRRSLTLTEKNLGYQYGSSDPSNGGMDCSGTIYHVLQGSGLKDVPRQSDQMYEWIEKTSTFHRTEGVESLDDAKFDALRPGDLLFWTGTYEVKGRASGVSHVMLYLGERVKDGRPVMFGASDGRSYDDARQNGVSVFDFKLPGKTSKAKFFGYGALPFEKKEEIKKGVSSESPKDEKSSGKKLPP